MAAPTIPAQSKFGIRVHVKGSVSYKTINRDNWRRLVNSFPALIVAAQELHVSPHWLRKQEHTFKIGWPKDRTPSDLRRPEKSTSPVLARIAERYSPGELLALAKGRRVSPYAKREIIKFSGEVFRFGFITDTHIGGIFFHEKWLESAYREFDKQKVRAVFHAGDVTTGAHPGRILNILEELTHYTYWEQLTYAKKIFSRLAKVDHYFIDGNHDRFFPNSHIVEALCEGNPLFHYMGSDEGDVKVGKCVIKLWHGDDGNSYATSYRVQKVVEAFSPGEKPNVLLLGHTHKALYMPERAIHCYSGGSIEAQSAWMRRKRIAAHTGFWIIELLLDTEGVARSTGTWYPFYA